MQVILMHTCKNLPLTFTAQIRIEYAYSVFFSDAEPPALMTRFLPLFARRIASIALTVDARLSSADKFSHRSRLSCCAALFFLIFWDIRYIVSHSEWFKRSLL